MVTQLVAVSVSATITVRIFIIFAKISKTSHFSSRIGVSKSRCGVFKKFGDMFVILIIENVNIT